MTDKLLAHQTTGVKIFGKSASAQAYALRDFLQRCDIPFEWIELKSDEHAREIGVDSVKDPRLPVCLFSVGTRLENPTIRQITEKLGWFRNPSYSEYDLAIYGAGPAGSFLCGHPHLHLYASSAAHTCLEPSQRGYLRNGGHHYHVSGGLSPGHRSQLERLRFAAAKGKPLSTRIARPASNKASVVPDWPEIAPKQGRGNCRAND